MADDAIAAFVFRTAFNANAALMIGLALHASLGVIERGAFRRWRGTILAAALLTITLAAARVIFLALQLGAEGSRFDPAAGALAWTALGAATTTLGAGAFAIGWGVIGGGPIALLVGALATAAAFAMTGHTQDLTHPGLAPAALALHALIAGFWIAAPLTLWPRADITDTALHARLTRFSAYAIVAIPVLIVVGAGLSFLLAGGLGGLLGTLYGRLLLLKLAMATGGLAAGAFNKLFVTQLIQRAPARGRRWLRRSLSAETALFGVAILAVSAATTFTGPGE